jgi:hypothetical protein
MISPNSCFGAASIYSNPAELAYMKRPNIMFDSRPGIGVSNLLKQSDIKDATDDILDDTTTFIFKKGNRRIDTRTGKQDLSMAGGFQAFAGAVPVSDYFVIGAGYSTPMDISMDMLINGISTNLSTIKTISDKDNTIDILLKPSIQAVMQLKASRISFAAAKEVMNNGYGQLAVGLTLDEYRVKNYISTNVDFAGMIVMNNSSEYYFNNPEDATIDASKGQSNKLFYKMYGNYTDTKSGMTLGVNYNPANMNNWLSRFNFSMVLSINPDFVLKDNSAYIESYQPKFLTGKFTGKDDEQIDIVVDSLDIDKPHLTIPTKNVFSKTAEINLPSSLTLGVDTKLGEHSLSLNLTKYFGDMAYKFDQYRIGRKMSFGAKLGVDLKFPEQLEGWNFALLPIRLLYLDIDGIIMQAFGKYTKYSNPHYKIYGGADFGDAIVEGIEDKDTEKSMKDAMGLPLPASFSIIREYTILDNVKIGTMVFGLPDIFLRFSVGVSI